MNKTHASKVALFALAGFIGLATQGKAEIRSLAASVNLTSLGQVAFTADVRNISNDAAAAALGWSGVTLNSTQWKLSDQYVLLNSTVTSDGGLLRIYTDNLNASPSYTGTSTSTAAGLVDNTDRTKTLPLAWKVFDTKTVPPAVEPNDALNGFGWFYFTDISAPTPDANLIAYRTLQTPSGMHMGIGSGNVQFYDPLTSPNYVFIQSNFVAASARTYSTDKVIIESITQ